MIIAGLLCTAGPAAAEWRRAETEKFIVYSDGGEAELRRFAQNFELFDRILRFRMGVDANQPVSRKLPIYLVSSRSGLTRVRPGLGANIEGFYIATDEDIFAIARRDSEDDTLLHEYAHHFMMQNFSYPYPAWYIEGFAEYYGTAEFKNDRVNVGMPNDNRSYWLQGGSWMKMSDLLASRPSASTRNQETYYPLAWLLTHWFMGDPTRERQLEAYLTDVGNGGDPVEAMQRATGLAETDLRRALRRYMRGGIPAKGILHTFEPAAVSITVLPRSADDLLLLNQRLKIGVAEDRRAETAAEVRRAAARHGDDPFAQRALGHAELHFGDAAEGERVLTTLLERHPDDVEALQLMAAARLKAAGEADDPDRSQALVGEARGFLRRALAVDDSHYATILLLAESRQGAAGYPTANDLKTWELAYAAAPQLAGGRFGLASALIAASRNDEAIALIEPLANSPHGGDAALAARALIKQAQGTSADAALAEAEAEEAAPASAPEPEGEDPAQPET